MNNAGYISNHDDSTARITRRGQAITSEEITRKQNLMDAWMVPMNDAATVWVFDANGKISNETMTREQARAHALYLVNTQAANTQAANTVCYFRANGMGLPLLVKSVAA